MRVRVGGGAEGDGLLDDVAPVGVVGGEVFLFGEEMGFDEEMAEVGKGVDHFGFDETLHASAVKHGEGAVEIAGGVEIGEVSADLEAGVAGHEALQFALLVKVAEAQLVLSVRHVAMAAVVEHEGAETGAVFGGSGHRSAPEN